MSSLLQCDYPMKKNRVGLLFSLPNDTIPCDCQWHKHDALYVAWRKPLGLFGHWVIFQYNTEKHVPDLSLPIQVDKLPKDAKRLSDKDILKYWHS